MFRSDLSDYSDTHIFVKGIITVEGDDDDKQEIENYPLKTISI